MVSHFMDRVNLKEYLDRCQFIESVKSDSPPYRFTENKSATYMQFVFRDARVDKGAGDI